MKLRKRRFEVLRNYHHKEAAMVITSLRSDLKGTQRIEPLKKKKKKKKAPKKVPLSGLFELVFRGNKSNLISNITNWYKLGKKAARVVGFTSLSYRARVDVYLSVR